MLKVQEYLLTHTLGELAQNHGIYATFSKCGKKFILNYDMLEAKESDPLTHECRGLILTSPDGSPFYRLMMDNGKFNHDSIEPGKTIIVCYGLNRFFNAGQGAAANIDWSDPGLSVMDKLDGTLIQLYMDPFKNEWCVSTRGTSEADVLLDSGKYTFRTLFEKAVKDTINISFEEYTSKLNKNITYCFELTSPFNRIVCKYDYTSITLLAARDLISLKEISLNEIESFGVPKVKSYPLKTLEDIHEYVSAQNPLEHEGVVVCDSLFQRIKVKNASYVVFNRARDVLGSSDRNCLELILSEKEDDVMQALPIEIQENLIKIKEGYRKWIKEQEQTYKEVYEEAQAISPDKKTFAILLSKRKIKFTAFFFTMFDGKVSSMKDFIQKNRKEGTWQNSLLDKILESITT